MEIVLLRGAAGLYLAATVAVLAGLVMRRELPARALVWLLVGLFLAIQLRAPLLALGAVVVPTAFGLTLTASVLKGGAQPLPPILHSVWLPVHVLFAFLGDAVFALACRPYRSSGDAACAARRQGPTRQGGVGSEMTGDVTFAEQGPHRASPISLSPAARSGCGRRRRS